jgi:acetyl-CoA synthetase
MTTSFPSYEELRSTFSWSSPAHVNVGVEACERQPRDDPAIIVTDGRDVTRVVSFRELSESSNRLANVLVAKGVGVGDRVGIILSQRPETAIAHLATYKLGAIAVPLSPAFGADALGVRLGGSEPRVIVAERESLDRVAAVGFDGVSIDVDLDLEHLLAEAAPNFVAAATTPDTPALLVYTSGTTGPPKGALHGHRVLAGHLPGFELSHDFFPQHGDRIWTPADWAWIGGLYDVVMPALAHGMPVVAFRTPRFDPERAFDVIARLGIRNVFMPATALRMMRRSEGAPVSLRTIASGGETVGEETAAWCHERFGVRLNEFYGQTEANLLIGNSVAWPARPGWMGRAYPGHELRLADGEIAVRVEGDPVAFLGYWRDEAATAAKVRDGWLHTGDLAEIDDDGNYRSIGRADDLISSGGHRIGPGEIEECLIRHPAVAIAAAIGVPDDLRGEVVKAFVVTAGGAPGSPELVAELQAHVRTRLAPYEVPRAIEFVDELPLTVTGKIRRAELRRLEGGAGAPPSSHRTQSFPRPGGRR